MEKQIVLKEYEWDKINKDLQEANIIHLMDMKDINYLKKYIFKITNFTCYHIETSSFKSCNLCPLYKIEQENNTNICILKQIVL